MVVEGSPACIISSLVNKKYCTISLKYPLVSQISIIIREGLLTGYNPGQQGGAYGVTSAISQKICAVCSIDRRVWDHTIDPWETSYTHEVSTGS